MMKVKVKKNLKPKYIRVLYIYMEYKEPNKRVTKNDKKNKRQTYSQKHIRNTLKQKEHSIAKRNDDGTIQSPKLTLLTNGHIRV